MLDKKQILSTNLKYYRLKKNLSKANLADLAHLPLEVLDCYENGLMMPSEKDTALLAAALDIPVSVLFIPRPDTLKSNQENDSLETLPAAVPHCNPPVQSEGAVSPSLPQQRVGQTNETSPNVNIDKEKLQERLKGLKMYVLHLSKLATNMLERAEILYLNDLVKLAPEMVASLFGASQAVVDEINQAITSILTGSNATLNQYLTGLDTLSAVPLQRLPLSIRLVRELDAININNAADLVRTTPSDIIQAPGIGPAALDAISEVIQNLQTVIESQDDTSLFEESTGVTGSTKSAGTIGRGYDVPLIKTLMKDFSIQLETMADWLCIPITYLRSLLNSPLLANRDSWTGKPLTKPEIAAINHCVDCNRFSRQSKKLAFTCYCANNQRDNFACIIVYRYNVKCFFLKDLPEDLQSKIIAANYHRFSEHEISCLSKGRIVQVLREPHFKPFDYYPFQMNAKARGMAPDEYSRFLSGYPLCDSNTVPDDAVEELFKRHLVKGKVYLPPKLREQWIFPYISSTGYSTEDFIRLLGYEPYVEQKKAPQKPARDSLAETLQRYVVEDHTVYLPPNSRIYRSLQAETARTGKTVEELLRALGYERTMEPPISKSNVLESDMEVHAVGSNSNSLSRIFAEYPLLGSKILSSSDIAMINKHARNCIDRVLNDPKLQINSVGKMYITLALINFAKGWNNEEGVNFWSFICLQFGYRDTNGAIVRLLQSCMEDALRANHRLFVSTENSREFKATVLIHALSTKRSWMSLLDFLFDFYRDNLQWNVVPGDPLIGLMVHSLQQRLYGDSTEDTVLNISNSAYTFQEGVRNLILLRPVYSRKLFEKLLLRIDSLVKAEHKPAETYQYQLCDEWFKAKIKDITTVRKAERQAQSIHKEIATDYTRIRAKYVLSQETDIRIALPDIRLQSEGFQKAVLTISSHDAAAYQQVLSWYGNELGRTLNGVSVSLSALPPEVDRTNIHVKVLCDEEEIYDSDDTLYRKAWAFRGGNECNIRQLKRSSYTVVLPRGETISAENAEVVEIDTFQDPRLQAFFLELKEGYSISLGDKLVAFETMSSTGIRISAPSESTKLPGIDVDGEEHAFAYHGSCCRITLGSADAPKQYLILRNGKRVEFSSLPSSDDNLSYPIPLAGDQNICKLQVINLASDRMLFDRTFLLVEHASCSFDRDFYYAPEDYSDAKLQVEIDDYCESIPFGAGDEEVRVPYRNGDIHIAIPKVTIQESSGAWMDGSKQEWYVGDIPQASMLRVSAPSKVRVRFLVDGTDILYDGRGSVSIGNALHSVGSKEGNGFVDVRMAVDSKGQSSTYLLARVCFAERFLESPTFWEEEHKLFWDHGTAFVGKAGRSFGLSLTGASGTPYRFKLEESTESIPLPETMPIGVYRYAISVSSGNLFKKTKMVLAQGDCTIGDLNEIRFKDRVIVIDSITDEFKEQSGHIPILPCYVEQLVFQGMEETSEGCCPIYTGTLYTELHGKRHTFSAVKRTAQNGKVSMVINPVRIVYINDSVLCITDPDGDGLYYAYYQDSQTRQRVYSLTDVMYTDKNKHKYATADLYSYRVERTEPCLAQSQPPKT